MSVVVRDYPGGRKEVDIRFNLPNGAHFRRKLVAPVSSESGARRWGEQRERDLYGKGVASLTSSAFRAAAPTLETFASRFIDEFARANKHKPSGIASKESVIERYLKPQFGSLRLDEITDHEVQKLKAKLGNLSPKTVNNILSVLNKMLKVAVEWRVILELPCHIKLLRVQNTETRFYSRVEYENLVAAGARLGWKYEMLVRLGGDLGLRRGEMIGIRIEDIDSGRRTASVKHNVVLGEDHGTKSLQIRRVPIHPSLALLMDLRGDSTSGPVLRQADGTAMSPKMLRVMMRAIQKEAGLAQNGALHVLRHTFCTHLAMAGVAVMTIQSFAGHAHLTTTLRYMHHSPGADQREAAEQLEAFRRRVDAC